MRQGIGRDRIVSSQVGDSPQGSFPFLQHWHRGVSQP
jgi:hypothetical protein